MIKVRIPTPLRPLTRGQGEVEAKATSVAELIEQLEARARCWLATQAKTRGGQSGLLDLSARDADDTALGELVRNLCILELGDHCCHVVIAESREGRRRVGTVSDGADDEHQGQQSDRDGAQTDALGAAQATSDAQKGLKDGLKRFQGGLPDRCALRVARCAL